MVIITKSCGKIGGARKRAFWSAGSWLTANSKRKGEGKRMHDEEEKLEVRLKDLLTLSREVGIFIFP